MTSFQHTAFTVPACCWLILSFSPVSMVHSFVTNAPSVPSFISSSPSSHTATLPTYHDNLTCRYVSTAAAASESTDANNEENSSRSRTTKTKMVVDRGGNWKGALQKKKRPSADLDVSFLEKKTELLLKLTAAIAPTDQDDDDDDARSEHERLEQNTRGLKINKSTFSWLIDAWRIHPGGDRHAESLLRRMQEMHERTIVEANDDDEDVSESSRTGSPSSSFTPDVRLFTKVIHAISRSGCDNAGVKAERILTWMEELAASGMNPAARPNALTYTAVVEAYANSGNDNHHYKNNNSNTHIGSNNHPNTMQSSSSTIVSSDVIISEEHNAHRADEIVKKMESLYESTGNDDIRPTARTFHALIVAWSRTREAGAAEHVADILEHMLELVESGYAAAAPNASSFNAVIDAFAKSGEDHAVQRAETIVAKMNAVYHSTKDVNVKPNTKTYNSLLNAYAKSGDPDAAYKAEETLETMIRTTTAGGEHTNNNNNNNNNNNEQQFVLPDVTSFSTVINAWARSHNFGKAEHALKILNRMSQLYKDDDGQSPNCRYCKPNVIIFNSVMNACAFTVGNEFEGGRALDIAHHMFRQLEDSSYGDPDSITYGTYLKVCANHMVEGELRRSLVEAVFKKCRRDGQVGELVLQQLHMLADAHMYLELTGQEKMGYTGVNDVPVDWRRNVREKRGRRQQYSKRTT